MQTKALVVIDIQNDITKHNNITAGTRTFKPGARGEELAPELKKVAK